MSVFRLRPGVVGLAVAMAGIGSPFPACAARSEHDRSVHVDKTDMTASNAAATEDDAAGHDALRRRYGEAIMQKILASWLRPANVSIHDVCPVSVRQIPGGQVVEAYVHPECPYDDAGKRSVERAILAAQPLPYVGFEPVFSRALVLRFRAAP